MARSHRLRLNKSAAHCADRPAPHDHRQGDETGCPIRRRRERSRMHFGMKLVWPALLALQMFTFGAAPALSATKVSFGQVSPTATVWPGVVAAKKGFFAANGVEIDPVSIGVSPGMQAVASGSLNIMHNTCNAVISFIESGGKGTHLSLVSMGIHPGVVVGKKGLKSASELKGKVVGTSS